MRSIPRFLFLDINEVCNLHCMHCDYWQMPQPSLVSMRLPFMSQLLKEFSALNPKGTVVIRGGEPTLEVGTFFELCRLIKAQGLRSITVTNGTTIANAEDAERMVLDGPDEISLSIDSPEPAVHDRYRGKRHSFEQVTNAVRLLVEARNRLSPVTKIYVIGLLSASTYKVLQAFYSLVLQELKADKLKLNVVQPTFVNNRISKPSTVSTSKGLVPMMRPQDPFFARESQVDPDFLRDELSRCASIFRLSFNPHWVRQVVSYFRGLWERPDVNLGWGSDATTEEQVCNAGERNIMVDVRGRASHCSSIRFSSMVLKNPGDLTVFWNSEISGEMTNCRALCGMCHAVRRESATTKSNTGALDLSP